MENARGQNSVGFAFQQHLGHVFNVARAAAGHHRHAHCLAHAPSDHQVKPLFGPVGVDAVENDFPRPEGDGAFGPFDCLQTGRPAPSMREDRPTVEPGLLRVNRHDDALAAEFFRAVADQVWVGQRRGIDADFISTGAQHRVHVFN